MVLPELRSSEPLVIALQEQLTHPMQRLGLPPHLCYGTDLLFDGEWL